MSIEETREPLNRLKRELVEGELDEATYDARRERLLERFLPDARPEPVPSDSTLPPSSRHRGFDWRILAAAGAVVVAFFFLSGGGSGDAAGAGTALAELARLAPSDPDLATLRSRAEQVDRIVTERRSGVVFVRIPGGTFRMGCTEGDEECDADETPHQVTVPSFWLAQTSTTVAQYSECVAAGVCAAKEANSFYGTNVVSGPGRKFPIVDVTWDDAVTFCAWTDGRLPSEAEYEYAARGGSARAKYPWGNDSAAALRHAHFARMEPGPIPVKRFAPNAYGLYDMAGNVAEWVQDTYDGEDPYTDSSDRPGYQRAPTDGSAFLGGRQDFRMLRGGHWRDSLEAMRVSKRFVAARDYAGVGVGFRCARS